MTIALGVINFDLLINSSLGIARVRPGAARDRRRVPHLHAAAGDVQRRARHGAVPDARALRRPRATSTGLRARCANGMRQIFLLLIPAAAVTLGARDADHAARLPARRVRRRLDRAGRPTALFWFSFSLPFNGANLLLTRTFFSLQRPWIADRARRRQHRRQRRRLAVALQAVRDRRPGDRHGRRQRRDASPGRPSSCARELDGLEGRRTLIATGAGCSSPRRCSALVAYGVWYGLDAALGRSLSAQIVAVGRAIAAGGAVYVAAVAGHARPRGAPDPRTGRRPVPRTPGGRARSNLVRRM